MEAVQTNIIGTDNVLHAAIDAGVERVVCLSTDKAAYPINAMGISKAMMEHVIYCQRPRGRRARRHDDLLHPLRQRHVQPRQRHSAVH